MHIFRFVVMHCAVHHAVQEHRITADLRIGTPDCSAYSALCANKALRSVALPATSLADVNELPWHPICSLLQLGMPRHAVQNATSDMELLHIVLQ